MILIVLGALGVIYLAIVEAIDWFARYEYMQNRWPGLLKWAEHKRWRIVVLLITFVLLARGVYDLESRSKQVYAPSPQNQQVPIATTEQKGGFAANDDNKRVAERPTKKQSSNQNKPGSSAQQQSSPTVQIAPEGINIGRDNNGTAIVNNGPSLPKISWAIDDNTPLKEGITHPAVWIRISIDRPFLDAKFAVVCDRPCKAVDGNVIAPHGGFIQDQWGTIGNGNYPTI
jgi:hypothetical protein